MIALIQFLPRRFGCILKRYENIVHTIWKQYTVSGNREIARSYLDSNTDNLQPRVCVILYRPIEWDGGVYIYIYISTNDYTETA